MKVFCSSLGEIWKISTVSGRDNGFITLYGFMPVLWHTPYGCGVYVYLIRVFQNLSQIDKLLHTFLFLDVHLEQRADDIYPMFLIDRLKSTPQGMLYETPTLKHLYIETEDNLAKSNTESIGEDDEEYGWN